MKTLSHAETSFTQLLSGWTAERIARTFAAIRPQHRADQITADVAASGNPSGA